MNKKMSRREALQLLSATTAGLLAACQPAQQPAATLPPATTAPTEAPPATATIPASPTPAPTETPAPAVPAKDAAVVYMTTTISADALLKMYETLGRKPSGKVAVKISSGEPGGHNYLAPELIAPLVKEVNGTIVECNTAYGGGRSNTESHMRALEDHGFTAIAPVDVMDAEGEMKLPISGGKHLQEDVVGSHFANYDFWVNLAHFKGHAMAGFGGVIKNMSIGIASSMGKSLIHTAGKATSGYGPNTPVDDFLESMADAAKGITEALGEKILYINVMNNLSVDCDCDGHPADPTMRDIGILASLDPVALDQACVDLVYAADDGADLIRRMESRHGIRVLEHGEAIGLGARAYRLVTVD